MPDHHAVQRDSSWHRPYVRSDGTSEQEFGYGTGDGTAAGNIDGQLPAESHDTKATAASPPALSAPGHVLGLALGTHQGDRRPGDQAAPASACREATRIAVPQWQFCSLAANAR